jgi:heme/copper-type cytochrome/quinol oxidase subunit 4
VNLDPDDDGDVGAVLFVIAIIAAVAIAVAWILNNHHAS